MKNDWLCKCGHTYKCHVQGLTLWTGEHYPTGCDAIIHVGDFCYVFRPDNLKSLEKQYEQTNTTK